MNGREFRIRWKRQGWQSTSCGTAYRQSEAAAHALKDKLASDGRPDLAPVQWVFIDERPVGDWRQHGGYVAALDDSGAA